MYYKLINVDGVGVMAQHTVEHIEEGGRPGKILFSVLPWHNGQSLGLKETIKTVVGPEGQEEAIRQAMFANGYQEAP